MPQLGYPRLQVGLGAITLGLLAIAGLTSSNALAADLSDFFGTYVGNAEVEPMHGDAASSRDMDIVIEPFHDEGFQIHWITVTKVGGRRDVPGVERDVQGAHFEPSDDQQFYVEVEADNPFREREKMTPMSGKAVRWASIDDDTLHVYSFAVLEDGRYELQVYDRVLTDIGMDIVFRRFDDGELVRQIKGSTVRVKS
jgi:hypothetical protein